MTGLARLRNAVSGPARLLVRAERWADQGRQADALALYDQLIARSPEQIIDVVARTNRAALLADMGHPERAVAALDEVLTRHDPDAPGTPELAQYGFSVRVDRAGLLDELGRVDEALAAYDQLLAQYDRHRWPEAREMVDTALLNRAALLAHGRPQEALDQYRELLTRTDDPPNPNQRIIAATNYAALLAELGRPLQALTVYDEVLAERGGPGEHWMVAAARAQRAELLAALGRPLEARDGYRLLLERHRGDADPQRGEVVTDALLALARLLEHQLDSPEEALDCYQRVAADHPTATDAPTEPVVTALRRSAELLDRLGRHREALAAHDRAERLRAPNP
ncbi:tetratricopeptide repeat protein [Pseudonocardia acaciae]|uniref:tetratricopeptide repeat protein n=1 Tax=Pseudonocardia acaciae TaxID=551276 RepID=UPI00048DC06A|nr:tetratricopeptide repeat protein [Pseudonocardia acaciae]